MYAPAPAPVSTSASASASARGPARATLSPGEGEGKGEGKGEGEREEEEEGKGEEEKGGIVELAGVRRGLALPLLVTEPLLGQHRELSGASEDMQAFPDVVQARPLPSSSSSSPAPAVLHFAPAVSALLAETQALQQGLLPSAQLKAMAARCPHPKVHALARARPGAAAEGVSAPLSTLYCLVRTAPLGQGQNEGQGQEGGAGA